MAPEGWYDELQLFTLTQALTANQVLSAELTIDASNSCVYYWDALGIYPTGNGRAAVRIRDTSGHMMLNTRAALSDGAPFGRADAITPLPIPHRMEPGSILTFDLQEIAADTVTIRFCLYGRRRWPSEAAPREAGIWDPTVSFANVPGWGAGTAGL